MSDKTFRVDVVSADRALYSGEVRMISATALTGELGILAGHVPLLAALKPGQVCLHTADGGEEVLYVSGGFIEVQKNAAIILADEAERAESLDLARVEEAHRLAEERMKAASSSHIDYTRALVELDQAQAQLNAIRRSKK